MIDPGNYAGVGCEMDLITEIKDRHDLIVISDTAQISIHIIKTDH